MRTLVHTLTILLASVVLSPGCTKHTPAPAVTLGSFALTVLRVTDDETGVVTEAEDFSLENPLPFAATVPGTEMLRTWTFELAARAIGTDGLPYPYDGRVAVLVEPGVVWSVNGDRCLFPDGRYDGTACPVLDFFGGEPETVAGNVVTVTVALATGQVAIWLQDANANPVVQLEEDVPEQLPDDAFLCGPEIGFDGLPDGWCPDGTFCLADIVCGDLEATQAVGVTDPPIFFENPRIPDLQFPIFSDDTPFRFMAVEVDNSGCDPAVFPDGDCLLVTSVTSDGFYVTDLSFPPGSYESLFVFNFSQPEDLVAGDVLRSFGGGLMEFVGFTEMTFPRFAVHEKGRLDLLDSLPIFLVEEFMSNSEWEAYESSLVRIEGVTSPTEFRDCDFNGDGQVNICFFFDPCTPGTNLDLEHRCADHCEDQPGCSDLTAYLGYGQYTITKAGSLKVNANSRPALPSFDPITACIPDPSPTCSGAGETAWCATTNSLICNSPTTFTSITGTVRQVTPARPRWIVEARTPDDICFEGDTC